MKIIALSKKELIYLSIKYRAKKLYPKSLTSTMPQQEFNNAIKAIHE